MSQTTEAMQLLLGLESRLSSSLHQLRPADFSFKSLMFDEKGTSPCDADDSGLTIEEHRLLIAGRQAARYILKTAQNAHH